VARQGYWNHLGRRGGPPDPPADPA
jgi:hypothetical protein